MEDPLSYIQRAYKHTIEYEDGSHSHIHLPHIRTELYPHQAQIVQSMKAHKKRMLNGFIHENEKVRGKIGIVADEAGSGKTLSVLAYLSLRDRIQPTLGELDPNSNRYFSSHQIPTKQDLSAVNVIIVPQYLIFQWEQEIAKHTKSSFRSFSISSRRILRNHSSPHIICAADCIITTNKMWREVYDYCRGHGIAWRNVFIDEATSIYMGPNDGVPTFEFLWLITSDWLSLQFRNMHVDLKTIEQFATAKITGLYHCNTESSSFYRQIIPWTHPARFLFVLRNGCAYPYPSLEQSEIICRQQYTLLNLPPSILGTNYDGLTNEKMPSLFSALGLRRHTIAALKERFGRSELINMKIDDDCCICLEKPQNTVILPCCMNLFCGACILRQLIMSGQCPTCRNSLSLSQLHPIQSETDSSQNEIIYRTKQETCLEYIRQHSANDASNSFIVYTHYENIYYQLIPTLQQQGIFCDSLEYNSNRISRTITSFNKGDTNVLFVSDINAIRGLTLSRATHLLLFSAIPSYESEQILLHSMQRLGSKGIKKVVQLVAH
jgi:SNF2-related domain/Zinc finger, C3HC4 type (RING finger)